MSASPSLPSPHEPFVDLATGKVSDVWFRYLTQELAQSNALTAVVGGLSTGTTGLTAVAFSSFATQAEQEAGVTATAVVTPSVQQYHPSAAKAWGFITAADTTTPVLSGSYNAASVSGTTDMLVTVSFGTAFSSTNYSVVATHQTAAFSVSHAPLAVLTGKVSTAFTMQSTGFTEISFACFGDQ